MLPVSMRVRQTRGFASLDGASLDAACGDVISLHLGDVISLHLGGVIPLYLGDVISCILGT